jgi:hypothetical protein
MAELRAHRLLLISSSSLSGFKLVNTKKPMTEFAEVKGVDSYAL